MFSSTLRTLQSKLRSVTRVNTSARSSKSVIIQTRKLHFGNVVSSLHTFFRSPKHTSWSAKNFDQILNEKKKLIPISEAELESKRKDLVQLWVSRAAVVDSALLPELISNLIKQKYGFSIIYEIAVACFARLNLQQDEIFQLNERLSIIKTRIDHLVATKVESAERNALDVEHFFFGGIPGSMKGFLEQKLQIANVLLKLQGSEAEQQQILELCLKEVTVPVHLVSLANTLHSIKNAKALNILETLIGHMKGLRENLTAAMTMRFEYEILYSEEERLQAIKKTLPKENRKRLDDLDKDIASGKLQLFLQSSAADPRDFAKYDDVIEQAACKLFQFSFEHRATVGKLVSSFITPLEPDGLPICHNPYTLFKIAQLFVNYQYDKNNKEDSQFYHQLVDHAWDLCKTGLNLITKYHNIQRHYQRLETEQKALELAREELFNKWEMEPVESFNRYINLEHDYRMYLAKPSVYRKDMTDLYVKICKLMVDGMCATNTVTSRMNILLEVVEQPEHLLETAETAHKYLASELVLKLGEKCQTQIAEIDKMRTKLYPLQLKIEEIEEKQKELAKKFEQLPPQVEETLAKLKTEMEQFPQLPVYADVRNVRQYDAISLKIVQVMTSSILSLKESLEAKIKNILLTHDPKGIDSAALDRERKVLDQQVSKLVQNCLQQFDNPTYLLEYSKTMSNSKEPALLVKIAVKALQRIVEIDKLRQVIRPLRAQLDMLLSQLVSAPTPQLEGQVKKLKQELEKHPTFPHYADLNAQGEFDPVKKNLVEIQLNSILQYRASIELEMKELQFKKRAIPERMKEMLELLNRLQSEVILQIPVHIQHPLHARDLISLLLSKNQYPNVLQLSQYYLELLEKIEAHKKQEMELNVRMKILKNEAALLKDRKRELNPKHQKEVEEIEAKLVQLTKMRPYYWNDLESIQALRNAMLDVIHTAGCEDISQSQQLIKRMINNEKQLKDYGVKLTKGQRFEDALELFGFTQNLVNIKKLKQKEYQKLLEQRNQLQTERELLDRKRRDLSPELQDKLLTLQTQVKLWESENEVVEWDNFNIELVTEQFECWIKNKKNILPETVKEREKKLLHSCLSNLETIDKLRIFVEKLKNRNQPALVIEAGYFVEAKIQDILKRIQERNNLEHEIHRMEQQLLILSAQLLQDDEKSSPAKEKEKAELRSALETSLLKLAQMPIIDTPITTLHSSLLNVAEMMIDAAKKEASDEILREQHIVAFRIDTKQERWDIIRNLSTDQEWNTVKTELVEYVIKQGTQDIQNRLDLFIKDELFDQAIKIFPDPSKDEKQLKMLQNLWITIEQKDSKKLEGLVPVVLKYMKRYFQQFMFKEVDPLLDQVQRHYPLLIRMLFSQACEMVLLTILPSQYAVFVEAISNLKHRLIALGRQQEWDEFDAEFKRKYRGKRRLIQMINLVGDSKWDLKEILEKEKQRLEKKKQREMRSSRQQIQQEKEEQEEEKEEQEEEKEKQKEENEKQESENKKQESENKSEVKSDEPPEKK